MITLLSRRRQHPFGAHGPKTTFGVDSADWGTGEVESGELRASKQALIQALRVVRLTMGCT